MSKTLFIDTSDVDTAKVAIAHGGRRYEKISRSRITRSQMVLPLIEEILSEHSMQLSDITDISVATGPGSYTGLRVGTSIANALGYLLTIPVNGKKKLAIPTY